MSWGFRRDWGGLVLDGWDTESHYRCVLLRYKDVQLLDISMGVMLILEEHAQLWGLSSDGDGLDCAPSTLWSTWESYSSQTR